MGKDKLVYCRVCGEQIAKSAKKCPKCGAKQKKGHGLRNLILLVIIVAALYTAYNKGSFDRFIPNTSHKNQVSQNNTVNQPSIESIKSEESTSTEDSKVIESPVQVDSNEKAEEPVETKTPVITESPKSKEEAKNGVTPEFKAYMDNYEAFMDDYISFMESYDASDLTMLTKYASLLKKYADFESKLSGYNEDNLSKEDYKYFIDVTSRINKRMIDVAMD